MAVYVGTCGFSYPEWVGPVYPDGTKSAKMLEVYSGMFRALEIDSTYYGPPSSTMFNRYPERTGGHLQIFMKLHKTFTHDRTAGMPDANIFTEAIKPLVASGQFQGFLAQFPQTFFETPENREYIEQLRDLFPDTNVVCEFRHEDWWKDDPLKFVADLKFPVVTVDAPDMSTLPPNKIIFTSEPGYIRLHGRNSEGWYKGANERYTYKYSSKELSDWLRKVKKMVVKADKLFVFFNNHPFGYAALNAAEFIEILRVAMPDAMPDQNVPGLPEQGKLFK
jgi:uncharacterized protein YecE (DUF72 family)